MSYLQKLVNEINGKRVLTFLVIIIIAHITLMVMHLQSNREARDTVNREAVIQKIMNAIFLVEAAPVADRQNAVSAMADPSIHVSLSAEPKWPLQFRDVSFWDISRALRHKLHSFALSIQMGKGQWLNLRATLYSHALLDQLILLALEVIVLGSIFMTVWAVNRFTEPLKQFKQAAEQLGLDLHSKPLHVMGGPLLVREADEAMNRFIEGSMVTLDAAYKEFRRMFFVMLDGLSYVDATHQQIRKTLESCEHVEEAVAAFYAYYDSIGHAGWLRQGIVAADKGLQTRETIAWQTYIVSASRLVEAAYSRLSGEEKEHFNRVVRPLYIKLSNGMSIKNAQQLLVLLESGFLRVTALGEHFSVTPRDTGGAIVSYRDRTGQEHRAEHPVVIRATGEDMRDIRDSSPLMENLFAAGMVRESFTLYDDQAVAKARFEAQLPGRQESIRYIDGYYYYVQGGLDFDLRTCEVNAMSPEHPSTNLFAIGVPLYQRSLLLHGVKPIKIHAIIIADRITGRIVRNLNPLQVEVGNAFMGSTKLADGTTIALTRRPVSSKAREMIATNLNIPKENIFTSGGLPPETLRLLVPSLQGQAASAL